MRAALQILVVISCMPAIYADPLDCNLAGYRAAPGLLATVANDALSVSWKGDNADLKMSFAIDHGTPTIRELAIRGKDGQWNTLATMVTPEFRVVSGLRRVSAQQLRPESLAALGVKLTPEIMDAWNHQEERGDDWLKIAERSGQLTAETLDRIKWEAFWDAPLYIKGSGERPPSHGTSIPPLGGLLNQP